MKTFRKILSSILICTLIFGIGAVGVYAVTVPSDPANLRANKSLYKKGEYISIFWDKVDGATDYWVNIYDANSGEKAYSIKNGNENSLSIVTELPPAGDYRLVVLAGNAAGYSAGDNVFLFTVYDSVPKAPENFSPVRDLYSDSENVVLKWDAVSAADKYTVILPDGTEIPLGNVRRYTVGKFGAGTYKVGIKAGNSLGFGNVSECTFTVYDTAPEAPKSIETKKNLYSNYESVTVSWTSVHNATEYSYTFSKDSENLASDKTESTSISFDPLAPGEYSFSVKAVNEIGESESVNVDFTVYLEAYTLSYDLNGGTGNFAPQSGNKTYAVYSHKPEKSGYEFVGWSNPASPITAFINPGDLLTLSEDTTLVAIWNELPPEPVIPATIAFTNSSPSSFNYGDIVIMKADFANAPQETKIAWEATNCVSISVSEDSKSCEVTSTGNGTATVTAKLVDSNGKALKDADGNEISVSREIKSNAGFFQKIISFFKNLFSISRIIAQAVMY